MKHHAIRTTAIAIISAAVSLAAIAQSTTPQTPSTIPGTDGSRRVPAAKGDAGKGDMGTSTATQPGASSAKSHLDARDRKFIEKAADGGMAEVALGKLAQERASSDQVKQFGRRMADDHGKANEALKQLAATKGVLLPQDMDAAHKRDMEKLQKLSGPEFDRAYMKHMLDDHRRDVSEFKSTAGSARDPDVRKFASTTLPTLEQHLELAQSTEAAVRNTGQKPGMRSSGPATSTPSKDGA